MDRFVYTALNGISVQRSLQDLSAQNLANGNVPGYRRDLNSENTPVFLQTLDDMTARAFPTAGKTGAFASDPGFLDKTDEPLDVAIPDEGYFYIKPVNGGATALSRRGDLRVGPDGILTDGAGNQILSSTMATIKLPPFRSIQIDGSGQITIEPLGGAPGEKLQVGMMGTLLPNATTPLEKGDDGQIRGLNGTLPTPNQGAKVQQGVLEQSNVNTTEELVNSIQLQRDFELNLKLVSTARDLDQAGEALIKMPEG